MIKPALKNRIPVLLSAFVCPGVGQFMQKRWVAGGIFSVGFLWGFFWLMILAIKIIIDFYRLAFEFDTYEPAMPNLLSFIAPVLISFIFYLASLFDVVREQQRIARKKQSQKLPPIL